MFLKVKKFFKKGSSLAAEQVEDLALSLQWLGFDPWPGMNFHVAKKKEGGSSCCGTVETNPTSIHEDTGSILASLSGSENLVLLWLWLWLWCRLGATALIGPLA